MKAKENRDLVTVSELMQEILSKFKIEYMTSAELERQLLPQIPARETLEKIAEKIENYENLEVEEREESRRDMQREIEYCIESYNALDIVDLKLLWYLRRCWGNQDGKYILLKYLKTQYERVEAVNLRWFMERVADRMEKRSSATHFEDIAAEV